MAVQGELLSMIMRLVEEAGTGIAFPSTTTYLTRDDGIPGPGAMPPADGPMAEEQRPTAREESLEDEGPPGKEKV